MKSTIDGIMKRDKQKILIFGLGYFERELIKVIVKNWQVTAVDREESRLAAAGKQIPQVQYIKGDISSILTWKKLDLTGVRYIISTIRERDVNLEVCRIARDVLKLKQPLMVLVYEDDDQNESLFKPFDVILIKPVELGIQVIQKKLEKNIGQAINIGLGKAEIIEIHVQSRSHLVSHKLKHLRPSQWHIAAVYRRNQLIIPTGNSSIQVGDRVVLVGDPKILENVADILIKGSPQFPVQYGTDIVFPLHREFTIPVEEAVYWVETFKAQRIHFVPFKKSLSDSLIQQIKGKVKNFRVGETIEVFKEAFDFNFDTGIYLVPSCQRWFQRCRTKTAFKFASKPFLITRNSSPYKSIIVSLNGPDPSLALDTAIEISRQAGISFHALYVALPREMRGADEEKMLKSRDNIIADFEGIHRETIAYHVIEGNPVIETLRFLKKFDNQLLILDHDPALVPSRLKPNVAYLIAKNSSCSTLVVPLSEPNE